jgi:hypothetical protein
VHCDEAWIIGLSNDGKQLKPQVIAGAFEKFTNGAGYKIRDSHGRRGCVSLDLLRDTRIQRRQNTGCDIGLIELRDKLSKHSVSILLSDALRRGTFATCAVGRSSAERLTTSRWS